MKQQPAFYHRRSSRLPGYNYSGNGAYFVTICAHDKASIFGTVIDSKMSLNEFGNVVMEEWLKTPEIRREINPGAWVIMPNHFHAIVTIDTAQGDRPVAPTSTVTLRSKSVGAFVAGFKSAVTKRINGLRNTPGRPVWQRSYYEHVIRDEPDLAIINDYIEANPARWGDDEDNPEKETGHA